MDSSLQSYLDTLHDYSKDESNALSALHLLSEVVNTDDENIGLNLEVVFNERNGLLCFLKKIRKQQNIDVKFIEVSFTLLKNIVDDYAKEAEQYIPAIFDFCEKSTINSENRVFKEYTYTVLIDLVKSSKVHYFSTNLDKLSRLFNHLLYNKAENTPSSTEKRKVFQLMGEICQHYCDIISESVPKKLLRLLRVELNKQLEFFRTESSSFRVIEVEGYFECLLSVLKNFNELLDEKEINNLYSVIKSGCDLDTHRKTSVRAAIKVIEHHFTLFSAHIYNDCAWWHNLLQGYLQCQNKDDQMVAFHALNVFYPGIAKELESKSHVTETTTLKYFTSALQDGMGSNSNLPVILAMKNFGYFANVCNKFGLRTELEKMFELTAQMVERYCSGQVETDISSHNLSNLLLSIAEILKNLYSEGFNEDELSVLGRLSTFVVVSYPKVPSRFQFTVKNNLINTIVCVALINETVLDLYLEDLMFVGLIKSCSRLLESDIEFLKEFDNIDCNELSSSRDYVTLWKAVCNIRQTLSVIDSIPEMLKITVLNRGNLATKTFDKFVGTTLKIIEKLDFTVIEDDGSDRAFSVDIDHHLKPKTEGDFFIFMNLVDVFSIVVADSDISEFEKWIPELTTFFIHLSSSCPIKSAVFQLLTVVFEKSGSNFYRTGQEADVYPINSFLIQTLTQVRELKGSDLVSCLRMVMHAPDSAITHVAPHIVSLLQIIFTLGLEDLTLAQDGLSALRNWYTKLDAEDFRPILKAAVPFLNPYMQNKKFSGDSESLSKFEQDLLIPAVTNPKNKILQKFRKAYSSSPNAELLKFQKQVVKFLGEIEIDFCECIYRQENCVTTESTEVLRFELPFADMKVKIFLDKFFPRVRDLACHSSELKTRVAACELLHSMTVVFLGNSHNLNRKYPKSAEKLFKSLLSCIFTLGSESNDVIKQLFDPLSLQLTHYYSSKAQSRSKTTDILLEILFSGVSNTEKVSLRYYNANLIHEFVVWSIKQQQFAHIQAVIRRIRLFCVQPCSFKKLGAALAFNSIYRELREEMHVLKTYWIELLYYFVRSLWLSSEDDCNNDQCARALDHIKRVLCEGKHIFLQDVNEKKRLPKSLQHGSLKDVTRWLFSQCLSDNKVCRTECMKLVEDLSAKLPGCDSMKTYFAVMENENREILGMFCERIDFKMDDLNDNVDASRIEIHKILMNRLKSLLSGLHCCHWLLENNAIVFEQDLLAEPRFWKSMKCFYECILPGDLEPRLDHFPAINEQSLLSHRKTSFRAMQRDIFLQYLQILTFAEHCFEQFVGQELWQQNMWDVLSLYLVNPSHFSSSFVKDDSVSKILSSVLAEVKKLPNAAIVYSKIRARINGNALESSVTKICSQQYVFANDRHHLNVLIILRRGGILLDILPDMAETKRKLTDTIFEASNVRGEARTFSPAVVSHLENVLAFSAENLEAHFIFELVFNSSELVSKLESCPITSHGQHFFNVFRKPLIEFLNRHQHELAAHCFGPSQLTKPKLRIIADCFKFIVETKTPMVFEDLVTKIFENWSTVIAWSTKSNAGSCTYHLIEAIASCRPKNLSQADSVKMFSWLLDCLCDEKESIIRKKNILKLLSVFIAGSDENNELLRNKLKEFQEKYFDESPTKLNEVEIINMYNVLLSLLVSSASKIVFEIAVSIAAADYKDVVDESILNTLQLITEKTAPDTQLEFLKTSFSMFEKATSPTVQLNCVQKFLVPLLNFANVESLQKFFVGELERILDMMKVSISTCQTAELEEKAIGTKTGAVLIAKAYCDIECGQINQFISSDDGKSVRSRISKTVLDILMGKVNLKNASNRPAVRKLKCYSYNTLIKMVMKVPKNADYYANLFAESPQRGRFIWSSVIDNEEEIKLKMFIDEISSRQKMIIKNRRELKSASVDGSLRSIPTQYLSTSSLVSEVVKFDMSEWNISSDGYIKKIDNSLYSVELEVDKLNNHECMTEICELVTFMVKSGISPVPDTEINPNPELPKWMEHLKHSLKFANKEKQRNVVMFILKLIYNCESSFRPFAYEWLDVMVDSVLLLNEINYFVADVIIVMLKWHKMSMPKNRAQNNRLLNLLLVRVPPNNTTVRNYQLELINSVIQVWHRSIDVPFDSLRISEADEIYVLEVKLTVAKRFLLCSQLPFRSDETVSFIRTILLIFDKHTGNSKMRNSLKRNHKIMIFEIIALILRVTKNNEELKKLYQTVFSQLVEKLDSLKTDTVKAKTELFASCLHHTLIYIPDVLSSFSTYVLHNFVKSQGRIRTEWLQIIAIDIKQLPDDAFSQLMSMQFTSCLRANDHELLKSALIIVKLYVNVLKEHELADLLPNIIRLSSHVSSECRCLIYDITDAIYSSYRDKTDRKFLKIKTQCKTVLLNGLLDPDSNLQEKMFSSWKTRCQLANPIAERFLKIIKNMYSSQNESRFVNYVVDYMLDACSSTPDFKSKIFDNPLEQCTFTNYQTISSCRSKRSIAPMFVNSFSSKLMTSLQSSNFSRMSLIVGGTQRSLIFQPTLDAQNSDATSSQSFDNRWQPSSSFGSTNQNAKPARAQSDTDPFLRKLQHRLLPSQAKASEYFASKNIKKHEKREELLAKRSDRLEKQVQFSREYRFGDFPDIEIPRSAVVTPLRILSKRDPVIAKLVFASVFNGMLPEIADLKTYMQSVSDSFNEILKLTFVHDSILIETLFEIAFGLSSHIHLDSEKIVISAHSSGLLSLGTLLLENSLCSKSHSEVVAHASKRLKLDDSSREDCWMQLAELYKALDKNDIVNGILKEQVANETGKQLKDGLKLEQAKRWEEAFKKYDEEVARISQCPAQSYSERFILEAYYKCAAYLSQWDDIGKVINKKFNDLNDMWNDNWNIEHTLPWFFQSEAYFVVRDNCSSDALSTAEKWLQDEERDVILTNLIAEPLSMMLLMNGGQKKAKALVNKCVQSILDDWNYSTSSVEKFSKLQTLSEIDAMLAVFQIPSETEFSDGVIRMLGTWRSNIPQADNIIWWDKRTLYRQRFSKIYSKQLDQEDDGTPECLKKLKIFDVSSDLQMVESALKQRNGSVAEKYLIEAYLKMENLNDVDLTDLNAQFHLSQSKHFLLQADTAYSSNKVEKYTKCLEVLEKYKENSKYQYAYRMHLANVLSAIIGDSYLFFPGSGERSILVGLLNPVLKKSMDNHSLFCDVHESILTEYREAASIAEVSGYSHGDISAPYLTLARYCRNRMIEDEDDLSVPELYIRSILSSMKFDSKEGQLLFPTLLQLKNLTNPNLKAIFVSESEAVEEWKFLTWVHQLLAYADTDTVHVIEKLILRIIKKYPNAVQFSFLSSDLEKFEFKNNTGRKLYEELRRILERNSSTPNLIKALACIQVPESFFKHCGQKLSTILSKDVSVHRKVELFENEIFSNDVKFKGKSFVEHDLWKRLKNLIDEVKANMSTMASINLKVEQYLKDCETGNGSAFLSDYSPWLTSFSEQGITDIEVPGQYDGFSPPDPERHVKIYEFYPKVKVQHSVQQPIKIVMIGEDAKKYSYLVKFGEDMRQDQRIQQIFSIMNKCSAFDSERDSGSSSVTTYGVFPLTTHFGIIQWLENTTPLDEFMAYGLSEADKVEFRTKKDELRRRYVNLLLKNVNLANHGGIEVSKIYEASVRNSGVAMALPFRNLSKEIPEDILKKSLLALCNSPTMYWNLRNQFIVSYSTMCVYGWILGIGDRHLKNILVCLKTGNCIGIDFGHAFGTGIECLPVPELIPFRMTPHIKSLMAPFYLTGFIRETMVNVLGIIHENEYIILAIMQIFILEPSINWLNAAKKRMLEQNKAVIANLEWYPAKKIDIVKRKLLGVNPIRILAEEIGENRIISSAYGEACIRLLRRENSSRVGLPEDSVTPTDHIECLLDLATDEMILGTSWVGLETYV